MLIGDLMRMAKRRRSNETLLYDGDDRITKLPESVICHILSRLDTKEAVQTSVLSKDWEFKWTSIYNIEIRDGLNYQCEDIRTSYFVDFMERMSLFSLLSHNVKQFDLSCQGIYNFSQMTSWIEPILGPELETLRLLIGNARFKIPQGVFNCTLLKSLVLESCGCILRVPVVHIFPNLTKIFFFGVEILNESSIKETMILKFPALKTFELSYCKWLNVKFVEIHAPLLETCVSLSHPGILGDLRDYTIKIIGAMLSKLELYDIDNRFDLTESRVAQATLHGMFLFQVTDETTLLHVRKIFNGLSSMIHLVLESFIGRAFGQSEFGFPRYDKLEHIQICDAGNINIVLELLHAAPHLKLLQLHMKHPEKDNYDYDGVVNVPCCIASSLKKVKFHYFVDMMEHQYRLEGFILKFGERLEAVHYFVSDVDREKEILRQLTTLPTASDSLEIVFDGY